MDGKIKSCKDVSSPQINLQIQHNINQHPEEFFVKLAS